MLSVISSAANSPHIVGLSGSGAAVPQATPSVTNLDFGLVPLGSSNTLIASIQNPQSTAIQLNSVSLTGTNADQFIIAASSCSGNLQASASCSIAVEFAPAILGQMTASLNITESSSSAVLSVSLTGTAVRTFTLHSGHTAVQAVFTPWDANWWLGGGLQTGYPWGSSGDLPVPADFDGDHQDDLATFTPATGKWLIRLSSNPGAFASQQWGQAGDVPMPADYDGDGKADLAVWRPSTGAWLIQLSSNPGAFSSLTWGSSSDIPVTGDFDGDGKADIAVWESSSGGWWIVPSSAPSTVLSGYLGDPGDIPVPGDYDGDGKSDFAVYRPSSGSWFIIPSSAPGTMISEQLGVPGDIPVPGDYSGTGRFEPAVWRPYIGYVFTSSGYESPHPLTMSEWVLPGAIP